MQEKKNISVYFFFSLFLIIFLNNNLLLSIQFQWPKFY